MCKNFTTRVCSMLDGPKSSQSTSLMCKLKGIWYDLAEKCTFIKNNNALVYE